MGTFQFVDQEMTDPLPDTPTLPDITAGIYINFDANSLSGADGSTVAAWLAGGSAPLIDRTFSKNSQGGGWGFPTLSLAGGPGGTKCVNFNGSQKISNTDSNSGADLTAIAQPTTHALVVKGMGGGTARFIGGTSGALQNIIPSATGANFSVAAGSTVAVNHSTADWTIIIVVFDGENSRIKVGDGDIIPINPGTNGYRGLTFGGSAAANASTGLVGGLAFHRLYNRDLSDDEMFVLHAVLAEQFGLD